MNRPDYVSAGRRADMPGAAERGRGECVQLGLDRLEAEQPGGRDEDVACLGGLAQLLVRGQELHGAHVVQPVRDLDRQNLRVSGLGGRYRLAPGARVPVSDLVQRGDSRHQAGDLGAELAVQLSEGTGRVVGRVVQQRRAQRLVAGAEPGQDRRNGQRVGDIRVAAEAGLAVMPGRRDVSRRAGSGPDRHPAGWPARSRAARPADQPAAGLAAPGRTGRRSQRRPQHARLGGAQRRAALVPDPGDLRQGDPRLLGAVPGQLVVAPPVRSRWSMDQHPALPDTDAAEKANSVIWSVLARKTRTGATGRLMIRSRCRAHPCFQRRPAANRPTRPHGRHRGWQTRQDDGDPAGGR